MIKAKEDNVIGDTTLTVCYSHCAKNIILKHLKGPTRTTFHAHITLILHTGRWGTKNQLVLHSGGQTDWLYTSMFTFSLFLCCYLGSSDKLFRYGDFLSEKNIVGPQEAQDPRFWLPWTMTHYILGSICFRTPRPPLYG